jgi:hypothetical protein
LTAASLAFGAGNALAAPAPKLSTSFSPGFVTAGTGSALTFTITAGNAMKGKLSLSLPAGWPASPGKAAVTVRKGSCASAGLAPGHATGGGWLVTFDCARDKHFSVKLGSASKPLTAPDRAGVYQFVLKANLGGGFKALRTPPAVTVRPAPASTLAVSGINSPVTAGSSSSITVTALDRFGNVATGYVGAIRFSSTDAAAGLPSAYAYTSADAGRHTFSGAVTLKTAGSQSVTATDSTSPSITGSDSVTVAAAGATHLSVSGLLTASTPGAPESVTVTARDAFGNAASSYRGTVHFHATDAAAALPSDYTFTAQDAGSHTFTNGVTLDSAGSQTLSATDAATASIMGSLGVTVNDALYVSTGGSDANPGSESAPLQTIGAALTKEQSLAGVLKIDVSTGTYDEASGLSLINGVTVTGGFNPLTWAASAGATTVSGSPQAALADAVTATLSNLTLTPTTASGISVYGVRAIDGADVTLSHVSIVTPAARAGFPGQPGVNEGAGGRAAAGTDSTVPSALNDICPGIHANQGYPGGSPGGGAGGYGGCGTNSLGGSGQEGCDAFGFSCDPPSQNGSTMFQTNGMPGAAGSPGLAVGTVGAGGDNGTEQAGESWLGANGQSGGPGASGTGGKGGGGGTGFTFSDCTQIGGPSGPCEVAGTAGAGGGAAGLGGGGGSGGGAGGGSLGVYLWNATVTITNSSISAGNGGDGGVGGFGGAGQQGGLGGAGTPDDGNCTVMCLPGLGGPGGAGGTGAPGGSGGGGAGGPSVGVMRLHGSTASIDQATTIQVGSGGSGGGTAQPGIAVDEY